MAFVKENLPLPSKLPLASTVQFVRASSKFVEVNT
jgi:hypothetical protein